MKLLQSPVFRLVLPSLAIFLLLRCVFWFAAFPNPDEAYYWVWGQHPDLSYYDHPPLYAWVQGLFTAILGRSQFVLRLPNLFSSAVCFYVYYRIANALYRKDANHYFGLIVALVLASPLYFLFLALAWHDHLLITFSLVSAYLFIRFLDGYAVDGKGVSWQLYAAAIAIALALLCKYNAVFVMLGLIATILSDQRFRPLLRDRRLYIAGAIAATALLPILLWNITNDFQSFRYYINRSVDSGSRFQIKLGELLKFLLYSILMLSPVTVWAIVQVIKRRKSQTSPNSTYRAVALWIFAVSTLCLMAISLVSTALYYWNITAYLLLFPLLPTIFLQKSGDQKDKEPEEQGENPKSKIQNPKSKIQQLLSPSSPHLSHKPLFLTSQLYGLLFATLLVIHYSVLPLSAFASSTDDPDSRLLFGWNDVETAVRTQLAESGNNPFLITTDYRSASALAYQLNRRDVIAISDRVDQFDFWYDPDKLQGRNAVILTDDWHPVEPELLSRFEQTSSAIAVPVKRFGVWIKNYYVVKGDRFKKTLPQTR
ncbi:MAG: 4-amino-4-deoxy-L-arabinose transferase [Leptolyngbyaceae cyanobacterium RU_5_1]|nr:4-amino-4-deoxy-L-arabinose transferase [Leptolyngbyaceae cyanobacterium RU_5_1]